MPKNKITDLNNLLFAQMERLNEDEITPEQLELEMKRTQSMTNIADKIIESNKVTIEAMKIMAKAGVSVEKMGGDIIPLELASGNG